MAVSTPGETSILVSELASFAIDRDGLSRSPGKHERSVSCTEGLLSDKKQTRRSVTLCTSWVIWILFSAMFADYGTSARRTRPTQFLQRGQ